MEKLKNAHEIYSKILKCVKISNFKPQKLFASFIEAQALETHQKQNEGSIRREI